jgi:RimJ/RimL family protein N-acetyltransferase
MGSAHSPAERRYRSGMNGLRSDSTIATARLVLCPLRSSDADEMVEVLADPALHEFTGGRPATLDELRSRYESWVRGSGLDTELWLNWVVRRCADSVAVGTVQATIVNPDSQPEAFVAWTIGTAWQRQGYATEATLALAQWLADNSVELVVAYIHADHVASAGVATNVGLRPTPDVVDGEVVWRMQAASGQSV